MTQTILQFEENRIKLDINGVDKNESPEGFYAELKVYKGYNICNDCDARKLCQNNSDDWCVKNRCMDYPVTLENGSLLSRTD